MDNEGIYDTHKNKHAPISMAATPYMMKKEQYATIIYESTLEARNT